MNEATKTISAAVAEHPRNLEPHFSEFVSAMTSTNLHSKGEIAMVLAFQAKANARLREALASILNSGNLFEHHDIARKALEGK